MYSKFGQFIDGKWQPAEKKETYDVINPATEEVIGKASKASSVDVQKALKSAEKGLQKELVKLVELRIYLNGTQKKQKEFMGKLLKVDFLTLGYMFITNQ